MICHGYQVHVFSCLMLSFINSLTFISQACWIWTSRSNLLLSLSICVSCRPQNCKGWYFQSSCHYFSHLPWLILMSWWLIANCNRVYISVCTHVSHRLQDAQFLLERVQRSFGVNRALTLITLYVQNGCLGNPIHLIHVGIHIYINTVQNLPILRASIFHFLHLFKLIPSTFSCSSFHGNI